MKRQEFIDAANDMAFMACIWIDDKGDEINDLVKFAETIFEKGRKQGIKQERALWELAKTSQEIGGYDL